jgi:glycolate oxidase iron-sulfur subunit
MDSPRGRIVLMKQVLESELQLADAVPHVDRCLGCLACESACPSGVRYRDLLVPFRAYAERSDASGGAWRRLLLRTLESPRLFRLAFGAARMSRALGGLVPGYVRTMTALLPAALPPADTPPEVTPAAGARRARVAIVEGCVQRVLRPAINRAARRFLSANGIEVVTPSHQGCCGGLALHAGFPDRAYDLAERNAARFPRDVDAIITTAAGCGSATRDMQTMHMLPVDVTEFLATLGVRTPLRAARPTRLAYQDACHLAHGQHVRAAPRQLLSGIADVLLLESSDGDLCCGSAGLYNLEHPDTAEELGRRKAAALRATGAELVATGNIGCLTQMEHHLAEGRPLPVMHTIEILDAARASE